MGIVVENSGRVPFRQVERFNHEAENCCRVCLDTIGAKLRVLKWLKLDQPDYRTVQMDCCSTTSSPVYIHEHCLKQWANAAVNPNIFGCPNCQTDISKHETEHLSRFPLQKVRILGTSFIKIQERLLITEFSLKLVAYTYIMGELISALIGVSGKLAMKEPSDYLSTSGHLIDFKMKNGLIAIFNKVNLLPLIIFLLRGRESTAEFEISQLESETRVQANQRLVDGIERNLPAATLWATQFALTGQLPQKGYDIIQMLLNSICMGICACTVVLINDMTLGGRSPSTYEAWDEYLLGSYLQKFDENGRESLLKRLTYKNGQFMALITLMRTPEFVSNLINHPIEVIKSFIICLFAVMVTAFSTNLIGSALGVYNDSNSRFYSAMGENMFYLGSLWAGVKVVELVYQRYQRA